MGTILRSQYHCDNRDSSLRLFLPSGDGEEEPQPRISGVRAVPIWEEGQRAGGDPETPTQQGGGSWVWRYKHPEEGIQH